MEPIEIYIKLYTLSIEYILLTYSPSKPKKKKELELKKSN